MAYTVAKTQWHILYAYNMWYPHTEYVQSMFMYMHSMHMYVLQVFMANTEAEAGLRDIPFAKEDGDGGSPWPEDGD